MEVKSILIVMFSITATISLLVIFLGCNTEINSIPMECAEHPKSMSPGSFVTKYDQCVNIYEFRENACADYFWWLRY